MVNSIDIRIDPPGYPADEYLVAKADMTNFIRSTMKSRNWAVQDMAEMTGLDPLQVEKIYNYRLKDYSIDEIKLVFAAVCEVEPDIKE
jgi:hypothetical protein